MSIYTSKHADGGILADDSLLTFFSGGTSVSTPQSENVDAISSLGKGFGSFSGQHHY